MKIMDMLHSNEEIVKRPRKIKAPTGLGALFERSSSFSGAVAAYQAFPAQPSTAKTILTWMASSSSIQELGPFSRVIVETVAIWE